jgi:hypothetical protein
MSVTELLEPVLTGGVRNAHFFNGRVLTAEDLRALQLAVATRQQQLGQAIGDGVVTGLEVSLDPTSEWNRPVVTIRKGLAINRRGDPLALTGDIQLALVGEAAARAATEGEFAECDQATVTLTNLGLYILVILPASGFEGRVPMTTVGMEGISGSCGSKYAVSGVRFRLVRVTLGSTQDPQSLAGKVTKLATELETEIGQLPPPNQPQPSFAAGEVFQKVSLLRSGAAHLCFNTEATAGFAADPMPQPGLIPAFPSAGVVDDLRRAKVITNCEVPLALVYWTSQGLKFVDRWSVRRMTGAGLIPDGVPAAAPGLGLLAPVLQFAEHLRDLGSGAILGIQPAGLRSKDYFMRLPSLGLLRPMGVQGIAGFNHQVFFQGLTTRGPAFIEGALLGPVWEAASRSTAIDLDSKEMIWLYLVRQNRQPRNLGVLTPPQPYLVFTRGQMPNFGTPRFDLNYWNYAHYG